MSLSIRRLTVPPVDVTAPQGPSITGTAGPGAMPSGRRLELGQPRTHVWPAAALKPGDHSFGVGGEPAADAENDVGVRGVIRSLTTGKTPIQGRTGLLRF